MRLLFFTHAFLPIVGGAERFLDQLARRLSARGHEVTVLAATVRGADNRVDAPYRLLRYRKPFSRRLLVRHAAAYIWRAARSARPDCLHAHGAYPAGYSAELYCRLARLPWALRPLGGDVLPGEGVRKHPELERRVGRTLRGATRVIAQSAELERIVLGFGVAPANIVRIPNAVDSAPFDACEPRPAPDPRIVSLAMFFRKKGLDVLLEAFAALRRSFPRARLVLAGDGPEREALVAQAARLELGDALELPGVLDEAAKLELLRTAWVFVSASRREPFSNANLEALAARLPLVATAVGGNLEIVEDGTNGLLVPPEDAPALTRALATLLSDAGLRARLGAASREAAARYGWERTLERYEAVYRELARPGS